MSTFLHPPMSLPVPAIPFFLIPTWETPIVPMAQPQPQQPMTNTISPPHFTTYHNFIDIDPLYYHWQMQGSTLGEELLSHQVSPTGPLQAAAPSISNNAVSSSQVPLNTILVYPIPMNLSTQKIKEALDSLRDTRTQIIMLKNIKVMVFNDKYMKKFILIFPQNLIILY